jgi:hypothetical protein
MRTVMSSARLGCRVFLTALCLLALLPMSRLPAEVKAAAVIQVKGRWIVGPGGRATPPGSFTRGLQTSGLVYSRGSLLSLGDQRSAFPGHVFCIDPTTARLRQPPVRIEVSASAPDTRELAGFRATVNPDFEGLTVHPARPNTLLAVTEDKSPSVAAIRLHWQEPASTPPFLARAEIVALTPVVYPAGVEGWRGDTNFRLEGCTAAPSEGTFYLAFERARDDLPRLLAMDLAAVEANESTTLRDVPLNFAAVARRPDKSRARLNLNGLDALRTRPLLVAVARDQERILVLEPQSQVVRRVVDLDLRTPEGFSIEWVSPEGLAVDASSNRLWLVNDPDSVRGNYRARDAQQAEGRFAEFAPLLFQLALSDVVDSTP